MCFDQSDGNCKQNFLKQLTDKCHEEFKAKNEGQKMSINYLFVLSDRINPFIGDKTKDKNIVTTNDLIKSEGSGVVLRLYSKRLQNQIICDVKHLVNSDSKMIKTVSECCSFFLLCSCNQGGTCTNYG